MGCKMKPGKKAAGVGPALAVLCLGSAGAFADITYIVDQTVTDGSKTGTVVGIITTDGALGTLLPSDFKSWNLELTGIGASSTSTIQTAPFMARDRTSLRRRGKSPTTTALATWDTWSFRSRPG